MPSTETIPELTNEALSRERLEHMLEEMRHQPAWRREADKCAEYYDGNQLSPEALEKLQDRGQPEIITNMVKPTIDAVLGIEKKNKRDFVVRPEDDNGASPDEAEALSLRLKHAEIESGADSALSTAFEGMVKTGLEWVEVTTSMDAMKPGPECHAINRREVFWDFRSMKADLSDAKWLIRARWMEVEDAIAYFPEHAEILRHAIQGWNGYDPLTSSSVYLQRAFDIERDTPINQADWRNIQRKTVCLYEIWYRRWVSTMIMELPDGRRVEFDEKNPKHLFAVNTGRVRLFKGVVSKIRLAWYCGPHFLADIPSPYKHNYFPYVAVFGYREDTTGVPYGVIRNILSKQDEINARTSKQMWLLNSRRVIADNDAVEDHELAAEEVARPDAYIRLNPNRRPDAKFDIEDGTQLAASQAQALMEAKLEIEQISSVHKAMLGQSSQSASGLAINSLVDQGVSALSKLFDNYAAARRQVGEMLLSMVIEDLQGKPTPVKLGYGTSQRTIVLNQPAQDPATGAIITLNDVRRLRVKVMLDDVPQSSTYRMQVMTMTAEVFKSLPPQVQQQLADFWIECTDLPNKEKAAERLRRILSIPDDSPAGQQQAQQAMLQQQQQQQQMLALEMAEKQARIEKEQANAMKLKADAAAIQRGLESVPNVALPEHEAALQEVHAQAQAMLSEKDQHIQQLQNDMQQREQSDRAGEKIVENRAKIEIARIQAEKDKHIAEAQQANTEQIQKVIAPLLDAIKQIQQQLKTIKSSEAKETVSVE